MDHTDRFFQDSLPQEASSDRQQYTFASPTTQPNLAATSMSHFSRIYDDRENIDPVTLRSAITGRRVFDREEPSISGSGMPRLVDAEGNDLPQSRSPLPENYPRVPLQDITAVLEQVRLSLRHLSHLMFCPSISKNILPTERVRIDFCKQWVSSMDERRTFQLL